MTLLHHSNVCWEEWGYPQKCKHCFQLSRGDAPTGHRRMSYCCGMQNGHHCDSCANCAVVTTGVWAAWAAAGWSMVMMLVSGIITICVNGARRGLLSNHCIKELKIDIITDCCSSQRCFSWIGGIIKETCPVLDTRIHHPDMFLIRLVSLMRKKFDQWSINVNMPSRWRMNRCNECVAMEVGLMLNLMQVPNVQTVLQRDAKWWIQEVEITRSVCITYQLHQYLH